MERFDNVGRCGAGNVFRTKGEPDGNGFRLSIAVTNFKGKAWKAAVSFNELIESQYDFVIEEAQLHRWLQSPFVNGSVNFKESPDAHVSVDVSEGDIAIEIRIPPEGGMAVLTGRDQEEIQAEIAAAMMDHLSGARHRTQQQSEEISRLQSQVSQLQEEIQMLQSSLGASQHASPLSADKSGSKRGGEGTQSLSPKSARTAEVDPRIGRAKIVTRGRNRGSKRRGLGRLGGP